jgi:hypothetical protein
MKNNPVKIFSNKNFILIAGLLFLTSASFHSVDHRIINDEISHIECLLCDNTVSDSVKSNVIVDKVSLSEILKVEINENFISFNLNSYHSRAPPK